MVKIGRKGKAVKNRRLAWTFGILLAIVVIAGGTYLFSIAPSEDDDDTTTAGCRIVPTISLSSQDALEQGTAVTTTKSYSVNGVYFATAPTFAEGDKVRVLFNASSYIDVLSDEITLSCGANQLPILIYDWSAPTMQIKEDNSVITDSVTAGTTNGSAIVSGGSETFEVCFTGTDKDSTGDFIYIVELGTTQNVSTINMYSGTTNLDDEDVPEFYTDTLTSPATQGFLVPAIIGAKEVCYDMTIVAKSGKIIVGAVYTTAYVGEPLIEDDGSFIEYGVEQSDGDSDYEDTFDYDIFLD